MKWIFCFKSSPTVEEDVKETQPVKTLTAAPGKANGKFNKSPMLVKQDSAYVEREDLGSFIRKSGYDQKISSDYSTLDSGEGRAAEFQIYGPPKPICNEERLANIDELGCMEKAAGDPQIQHIMQLMCTVFQTDSALVALVGDDSIYIADSINFKRGDFPWRMSFCAHSMTPANHQVLVIEDAAEDSRFKHLPMVKENIVRFYAGTPIVSSRGHRLGTVCFASDKPRKFDAEGCTMLTNMGELVTSELEREWAAEQQAKSLNSKASDAPNLVRAIECFNDAVMFVDVSQPNWKIMHMNAGAQTRLKLHDIAFSTVEGKESSLWQLFHVNATTNQGSAKPWEEHEEDIKAGRKFEISGVMGQGRTSASTPQPVFNLTFRCAANDQIDDNTALVGTPAYLPSKCTNRQFYFATLSQDNCSQSRSSVSSIRSQIQGAIDPATVPFENLEIGALLGKGGYGRVYRGIRDGQQLAVKVISNTDNLKMVEGEPLEAAITRDARHRNIVNTLDYAVVNGGRRTTVSDTGEGSRFDSASSRLPQRQSSETWMLLEFCDLGCLQEASDRGFFRPKGKPDFGVILSAAADIAAGMAFLHSKGVVHGDLTGGNVLLATDASSVSGVVAKVADFGLARSMDIQSKIETRTYGTVTHMPPELLEKGIFSKAADAFSLGVLLWEMYHGVRAWSSMNHAQIITAVAVNKTSLKFSSNAPVSYVRLAMTLMSQDPSMRPTLEEAFTAIKNLSMQLV